MPRRGAVALVRSLVGLLLACSLACSPSPRDVVPASRDVRTTPPSAASETYAYVARRPHGAVALAEARHMSDDFARATVDRIADELERCASGLEARALLVEGAVRVVAVAGPDGTPVLNVRLAPGDGALQNALLCILAPVRATTLPLPTPSGTPGIAIEATWGPTRASDDAGAAGSPRAIDDAGAAGSPRAIGDAGAAGSPRAIDDAGAAGSPRAIDDAGAAGSPRAIGDAGAAGESR